MERHPDPLETLLRTAPVPRPPASLKEALLARARGAGGAAEPVGNATARPRALKPGAAGGWRRWVYLAIPAGTVAALATAVVVQQQRLEEVRLAVERSRDAVASSTAAGTDPAAGVRRQAVAVPDERREIERLRKLVTSLEGEVATVRRLEEENARLRAAIAAGRQSIPSEFRQMTEAQDRSRSIVCVNNLKQIGLAVRLYATDNGDEFPPDFQAISGFLGSTKVLVCPSDSGRVAAENARELTSAHISYEFLSPGPGKHELEPTRVLVRCPVHGHVGLCDGSVHQGVARNRPEELVMRDGVLHMQGAGSGGAAGAPGKGGDALGSARGGWSGAPGPVAAPQAGPYRMPPEMARRYGLAPTTPEPVPDGSGGGRAFEWGLEGSDGTRTVERRVVFDPDGREVQVDVLEVGPRPLVNDQGEVVGFDDPGPLVVPVQAGPTAPVGGEDE